MIYIFFNKDGTPNSVVSTTTLVQGSYGIPVYVGILNSEFDVIEGLKLTCEESKDLIVYSIFKSPITTDFEIKDTINECTFYDSIYGRAKITNSKTSTEEE